MKIYSMFVLGCLLLASSLVNADDHDDKESTLDGAATTLVVATSDFDAYLTAVKSSDGLFEESGALAAGYCRTMAGQDYQGQMMIWNFYEDVSAALVGSSQYDPSKAPASLAKLREVKYGTVWKPLKAIANLSSNYERVLRIKVSPENVKPLIDALIYMESEVQKAGFKSFQNGLFRPIGSGSKEVGTLTLRYLASDAETHGKIIDDYYSGGAWVPSGLKVGGLIDEVQSDSFEQCEVLYMAK